MKEKLIGGLIGGREKSRYTLEYHYLGDSETRKSEFVCMTMLDAINRTFESENWRPIVFDTIIVKENIGVETIVGEIKIVEDNK